MPLGPRVPWVVLRHDLPDGSWHFDLMIARDGPEGEAPLITFRVPQRPDEPGVVAFAAERVGDHRREYLSFEGMLTGGRGSVRRVAAGACRVARDDLIFEVELIEPRERLVGRRRSQGSAEYLFERTNADQHSLRGARSGYPACMDVTRVLISRDRIASRVAEMGRIVTAELRSGGAEQAGRRVVLVPILTGSLVFVADLIRHIPLKMNIRPVTITSYPGAATTSQGANIQGSVPTDLHGADVLLVDDILDSGRTLGLLKRVIDAQRPASLRTVVLLRKVKASGREEHVDVDLAGFDIGDEFVVGYGLDYDGYFRNLPDIGVLG